MRKINQSRVFILMLSMVILFSAYFTLYAQENTIPKTAAQNALQPLVAENDSSCDCHSNKIIQFTKEGEKSLLYPDKSTDFDKKLLRKKQDTQIEKIIPDTAPHAKEIINSDLFHDYEAHATGSRPEAVAIGDVNNDGRNDVVMTTSYYFDPENDNKLFVYIQNTTASLNLPLKYDAGDSPESIDVGDLNNDGKNDVVVGNSLAIGVFIQNDAGGFWDMESYASEESRYVKIGDFNNDGLFDVSSMGWGTNKLCVHLQNTSKTLSNPKLYSVNHGGFDELESGDVNDDGLDDIIVMSGSSFYDNFGVLLQNKEGTMEGPFYYDIGGGKNSSGIAVRDVDSDFLNDVVLSYGGNKPNSNIAVFRQNTSGTLSLTPTTYPAYDCPEPVEIADVSGDGRKDVIVAHGGWLALGVFLQNSNGELLDYEKYSLPYASHYNPQGLAIGDINSDGARDVVIADSGQGLVVLYSKKGIAEFNLIDFLLGRKPLKPEFVPVADRNWDNIIDVADVVSLIILRSE